MLRLNKWDRDDKSSTVWLHVLNVYVAIEFLSH